MSGDYSRLTFDSKKHYIAVLKQQGRVQLDSDWNEFAALLDRRWRAETTDIVGRSAVPKETPDGFRIQITAAGLVIGPGRIYVDGMQAENHGKAPLEFDAVLAERRGTLPVPYNEQPYFPNVGAVAPAPTTGGPHLVYLDVWTREVTALDDSTLIEKAVGVDTTTRMQTAWQVKILANAGPGTSCGSPPKAWNSLIAPSDGRLTTAAVGVPTNTDPCLLPPSGGYRGLENRLYRVEIHDGGPQGNATFKWTQNGAVAAAVTAITALNKLTVASLGHDSVMRFRIGDWIEITDDRLEFARQPGVNPPPPGVMAQIKSIDDANRIITLVSPIPASVFATDAQGNTDPALHTQIQKWDQTGQIHDTNGNLLVDLNAPGAKGVIPVPATGVSIVLEDGVQITFDTPGGGNYRIGDYWNFTARTADASVEELKQAPPLGVHHHFSRLAVVTFPNSVSDCRTLWPPEVTGESCECTVCVSAESHNQGKRTIQLAIDQVKAAGGGTICLGAGHYNLGEAPVPINISGARSLSLRGQGTQTSLTYVGRGPALVVDSSNDVTIERLTLVTSAIENDPQPAIMLANTSGLALQRCTIQRLAGATTNSVVVGLAGTLVGAAIRENVFQGPVGVGNVPGKQTAAGGPATQPLPLLTLSLAVRNNAFSCSRNGISLTGTSMHVLDTHLSDNFFNECSQGGIVVLGFVPAGSSMEVHGNELNANGAGIVVGTSGTRITANSISGNRQKASGDGIVLVAGLDRAGIDQCQVIGNRIVAIGGIGISAETVVKSAMIKNNFIDGATFGAIVMGEKSSGEVISLENNQISNIAPSGSDKALVIGIRLVDVKRAQVVGNVVSGVGVQTSTHRCVGIQLLGSASVRVACNDITDIGPAQSGQISAGIETVGTFDQLDLIENHIRRNASGGQIDNADEWYAVLISGARLSPPGFKEINALFGAKTNTSFLFLAHRVLARLAGGEMLSMYGNFLEAYGRGAAVRATLGGPCTFNNNRSLLQGKQQAAVEITAGAAVLNANHVQGTQGKNTILIQLPDKGPFTVLGNITTHSIEINGAVLGNPWAPLNIQVP